MKKLSIILISALVALAACTKSKEVHPEIGDGNDEILTVGIKDVHVEYTRTDHAELNRVVFHYSLAEVQQFEAAEMAKRETFFELTLDDLLCNALYSYYYELFYNGGETSTTERKTFRTQACDTPTPPTPPSGEHEYVDLGLPSGLLWATCNVGANAPEEYGDYFAWGETQPKDVYDWSTYQYCNGSINTLTKYCNRPDCGYNGFTDNLTTLLPEDDAAAANWGGDWHMPSYDNWVELYENTTHIWTTRNGVNGRLFTGSNGNSLFLPAAGNIDGSNINVVGSDGNYWPTSFKPNDPNCAYRFDFGSDFYYMYYGKRSVGNSVRAVRSGVTPPTPPGGVPEGAINGLFTINANGDQVYFSQGNLQYQASTNIWRFAEHQWDFVGDDTRGSVYESGVKCNNALVSSTYSGWIDMFGWGTSGYNHGANCYQPWSVNDDYYDYYAYGSPTSHLYEQSGKADWGYNAISNGGNQENLWRSLSNDEWDYLLNMRTTTSGIRYAKAYLNGVAGLVITSDTWDGFVYGLSSTNDAMASYSSNSISLSDWNGMLQMSGVVFLPAAGSRRRDEVSDRVEWGQYWTASYLNEWMAYPVSFDEYHLDPPNGYDNRFNGQTVRLVQDAR